MSQLYKSYQDFQFVLEQYQVLLEKNHVLTLHLKRLLVEAINGVVGTLLNFLCQFNRSQSMKIIN